MDFITDLTKQIKNWQKEGQDIILMLDANEPMNKGTQGMAHLATECNLTDVYATRNKATKEQATYARGTKRINFILISAKLLPAVTQAGALAFYDGIESDHRGIFVNFDEK